jgi:hypothetical protein
MSQHLASALQELPYFRRPSIELRKTTIKSAHPALQRMAQAPLWTLIFHGSFAAYRKNGKGRRMSSVAA